MAVISLILGISSAFLFIFTGIPAIILGIIALVKIGESGGTLKGKGLAIAGIVISTIFIIMFPLLILSGLLIPSLCLVKNYSREIQQKGQFYSIDVALEMFRNEVGDYPPSNYTDINGNETANADYCGAQKLAEVLVGQDLLGFHPDSKFRSNGMDDSGKSLYVPETLKVRKGPYIDLENANVYQLKDIFEDVGTFDENSYVVCDTYTKNRHSGKKTGMPILYYRANTFSKTMDTGESMDKRIYNAQDNLSLIRIAKSNSKSHPLAEDNGRLFYDRAYKIIQPRITTQAWPYRADSYILISAGPDGLYGTSDDIVNFEEKTEK
jgi:hypothetical protein